MKQYKQLLLANKAWASELKEEKPDFFSRQTVGQRPEFLWIGCSDSRVSPEQMTMALPGGMFIHRNVANLVNHDDMNLMSVLQYAVDALGVRHIIICGHHGCGGVTAALKGGTEGVVHEWLANARAVRDAHAEEIDAQTTEEAKVNRLVEVNVRDQAVKLAQTNTIRNAFARGQELWIHGWVYDIRDGLIRPLLEIDRDTVPDDVAAPERVLLTKDEMVERDGAEDAS
ncbi:carbonic anhydrase [Sphingomonas sp.]|jgi:carbonic anhydrase|uniref:carbonic anhydrase n=1 Tax=Sphingomonas sp. TaxID=28214 RepID=UPI002EDA2052